MALDGVGMGRRVGDEFRVTGEDRVDHLEACRPQRPAGLGDVDHDIHDVGHLGLGGTVRKPDVGLDALLDEVAAGHLRILARDPNAVREVGHRLVRGVAGDGHDDLDGTRRRLRIVEFAEGDDIAARLLDPVPTGDAEVEQPVGHIGRDLLRTQDPDIVDARVGDGRPVVDRRVAADGQVGGLEQVEGRLLEGTLGKHQFQHRTNLPGAVVPAPGIFAAAAPVRPQDPSSTRSRRRSSPNATTEAKRPRHSSAIVGAPGPASSGLPSSPPNSAGARYTT